MLTFTEFVHALHRLYPQNSPEEISSDLKRNPSGMIITHCDSPVPESQEIIGIMYENANDPKSIDGKRALLGACYQSDPLKLNIVRLLVEKYGIDPCSQLNNSGETALQIACTSGNLPVVKYLIETCKCDHTIKYNGQTLIEVTKGGYRFGYPIYHVIQYLETL